MFCLDPQQGNCQAAPRRFPPLSGGKLVAQGRVFAKQVRELAEAAGGCLTPPAATTADNRVAADFGREKCFITSMLRHLASLGPAWAQYHCFLGGLRSWPP